MSSDRGTRLPELRRQLPFAIVLGVVSAGAAMWEPTLFGQASFVSGMGVGLAATVLAAVVPWRGTSRSQLLIPVLDIVAVALVMVGGFNGAVLLVLPALTLARHGGLGLVTAIAGGTLAAWAPEFVTMIGEGAWLGITSEKVQRLIIVPAVIAAAAGYLRVSERRSAARRALLAGQGAIVEDLLAATRRERRLLEGVLNTVDTGVVVLGPDGTITVVNRTIASIDPAIYPGVNARDLTADLFDADGVRALDPARHPVRRAAAGERIDREVIWWHRGDRHRTAYRVTAAPLEQADGGTTGAVIAFADLTDELEALAQREEFVSSVSHELRTPLTSVAGYLDLAIAEPGLPEAAQGYLEVAERNTGRLRVLIDNLLAAARARGQQPAVEPIDLAAVVADVVESQAPRAREARVTVHATAPSAAMVDGDDVRLTQVVDNVVSNAIKYSRPDGEVQVSVRRAAAEVADDRVQGPGDPPTAAGGVVRLEVRDNGAGIAEDDLPHVFTRFYRAPAARRGTVAGTGLGLSITRQIVQELGGRIALHSELGVGTSIVIEFPEVAPR